MDRILKEQDVFQALHSRGSLLLCYFKGEEMILEEVILSPREMTLVRRREKSSQRLMKQYKTLYFVSRSTIQEENLMDFLESSHTPYQNALVI